MSREILKQALAALGKDWRRLETPFVEAFDHRGRGLRPRRVAQAGTARESAPM